MIRPSGPECRCVRPSRTPTFIREAILAVPVDIQSPPRDFAGLKALIGERAGQLPKRLTQIATFALDNPDDIAFGTV